MPYLEPQRYQFTGPLTEMLRQELDMTFTAFATSGGFSVNALRNAIARRLKGTGVTEQTAQRVAEHYAKLHGTTAEEELNRLFVPLPRQQWATRKSSLEPLPQTVDPDQWYSTRQAAHVLGLNNRTILKYINNERLNTIIHAERHDGIWRIRGSELLVYQERHHKEHKSSASV